MTVIVSETVKSNTICDSDRMWKHSLLSFVVSLLNYLLFSSQFSYLSYFLFDCFNPPVSASPIWCFICTTFIYSFHSIKIIFTFPAFLIMQAEVGVTLHTPVSAFHSSSPRPAIGILLTLACLIRMKQRERKTKASLLFLLCFPPHVHSLLVVSLVLPPP